MTPLQYVFLGYSIGAVLLGGYALYMVVVARRLNRIERAQRDVG